MPNGYTFDQVATLLNQIVADAQGRTPNIATTPRTTADFVSMATTALSTGTDPIMRSVQQLIAKSIFSARSYSGKFRLLDMGDIAYGNAVRKITPIFTDGAQDQPMFDSQPADGLSTDQYKIKRPKSLQTNFLGSVQWMVQAPTVFEDQLRSAFRAPGELGEFLAAQTTAVNNELKQQAEQLGRMTASNFIGAKIHSDAASVIHILTEYNQQTGLSLTDTTVYQPSNFPAFTQWLHARLNELSDRLENRSVKWHKSLTGFTILRHTDKRDQRLLMYSPFMRQMESMALSSIYHDDLLKIADHESVTFWQNENQPMEINVTCSYIDNDGSINRATVAEDKVVGILYDKEAMGYNMMLERTAVSPLNASGLYYNTFHHFNKRYLNDLTESAIVFVLD